MQSWSLGGVGGSRRRQVVQIPRKVVCFAYNAGFATPAVLRLGRLGVTITRAFSRHESRAASSSRGAIVKARTYYTIARLSADSPICINCPSRASLDKGRVMSRRVNEARSRTEDSTRASNFSRPIGYNGSPAFFFSPYQL